MKKILVSYLLLFMLFTSTYAQRYNFAGGIRLGTELGFTFKYRIAEKLTLEGIIQSPIQEQTAIASLLVEKHNSVLTKGLNIYVGGGLQKGWVLEDQTDTEDPFGVVGIIGAEFNFARLNLSYDIKPAVNLVGGSSSVQLQTGISVRYIFSKDRLFEIDTKKSQKKKRKKEKAKAKKKKWKQKIKDRYSTKKQTNE